MSTPIPADRVLAQNECHSIFNNILSATNGAGDTVVGILGSWRGNLRWAMNQVISSGDIRDHTVHVHRKIRGAWGMAVTNQLDEPSLRRAAQDAEKATLWRREVLDVPPVLPQQQFLRPEIFYTSSYQLLAKERSDIAQTLVAPIRDAGFLAAGYLESAAEARAVLNTNGMRQYYTMTNVQYSVTVRDPKGTGSGWAGIDHHDWSRIDSKALTERALQKCRTSMNARMIEPGRYTVILEPQAVHQLMHVAVKALRRRPAEHVPVHPYFDGNRPGWPVPFSKIGKKIMDERLSVSADPMNPVGGFFPFDLGNGQDSGEAYRAVTWIQNGILQELQYSRGYAIPVLRHSLPLLSSDSYRVSGGETSTEEMIATTRRGLLATRFGGLTILDHSSLLCLGTTRDGLWLIENGKITTAAKNMRFTESPLFAFNNVEQIGTPIRVFSPEAPAIVPPIKVNDFSFTSLADAV